MSYPPSRENSENHDGGKSFIKLDKLKTRKKGRGRTLIQPSQVNYYRESPGEKRVTHPFSTWTNSQRDDWGTYACPTRGNPQSIKAEGKYDVSNPQRRSAPVSRILSEFHCNIYDKSNKTAELV